MLLPYSPSSRASSGRSSSSFQHRIEMDLWYVRNWSLWYDLVIMLRTVGVVFKQEGAC